MIAPYIKSIQYIRWSQVQLSAKSHKTSKKSLSFSDCYYFKLKINCGGFPGGTVVKNPPANAEDTGSSPGPGRSLMPRSN